MRSTVIVLTCVVLFAATAYASDSKGGSGSAVNPCNPENLPMPPIWTALADLPCASKDTRVQAGADVTVGSKGDMKAALSPIASPYSDVEGMCVVNVHWHFGAEHRNKGTYDIPGSDWMAKHGHHRRHHKDEIEPGNFCPGYDASDPKYTTEYKFKHCSDVHVGYTYELHWPNSNLGMCGSEWQYQSPFMNGVLCKANEANMAPADAAASVFESKTSKIGVQAQIFTVVNDPAYDYPDWEALKGWNTALAKDVAVYQGSTTGQKDGNKVCRGTGGMVTWQVDRGCHLISAKALDNLCKEMKAQKVDMSQDTRPRNARKTTDAAITTNVPMGPAGPLGGK